MFRMWAKIFKDNRMLCDTVIENEDANLNRTRKVYNALDSVCYQFDLSRHVWLDKNITEFKRCSKVRFHQDNFIDQIDFDYLELQVIEED